MKIFLLLVMPLYLFSFLVAPSNLILQATNNSVTLQWEDNSEFEKGFKIYRDGKLIDIVDENVTSYRDVYLFSLTEYHYTVRATEDISLDEKQRQIVDEFVSIFEHDTVDIDSTYKFIKDINDTRGYTAGRAGFTSATGDMLIVIERYTQVVPNNVLYKHIDELRRLERLRYELNDKNASASTKNLGFLKTEWGVVAEDDIFKRVQDKVVYEASYYPAVQKAYDIGAHYPLTVLSLYDTAVQHGYSGLLDIMGDVTATVPKEGGSEEVWLREFNDERIKILEEDKVWAESVARVNELVELIDAKNYTLLPYEMFIEEYKDRFSLGE